MWEREGIEGDGRWKGQEETNRRARIRREKSILQINKIIKIT